MKLMVNLGRRKKKGNTIEKVKRAKYRSPQTSRGGDQTVPHLVENTRRNYQLTIK